MATTYTRSQYGGGGQLIPFDSPQYEANVKALGDSYLQSFQANIGNYNRSPVRKGLILDFPSLSDYAYKLAQMVYAGELDPNSIGPQYDITQYFIKPFISDSSDPRDLGKSIYETDPSQINKALGFDFYGTTPQPITQSTTSSVPNPLSATQQTTQPSAPLASQITTPDQSSSQNQLIDFIKQTYQRSFGRQPTQSEIDYQLKDFTDYGQPAIDNFTNWAQTNSTISQTGQTGYENLANVNGTIYNTQTGRGYETPQELASDLRVAPDQIQWQNIATGQLDASGNVLGGSATGNPAYDTLLDTLSDYLQELQRRGQVVNPDITLTPQQIAEFTAQAEREINPYYASQLRLARGDLLRSVGYSEEKILQNEKDLEIQYGRTLRQLAESSAEKGFALSGIRQREETQTAEDVQRQVESGRRELGFATGTAASQFARQYGSSQIPTSGIAEAPRVLPGESSFQRSGRTLPTYQLSDSILQGLVGEQEYQQQAALRSRTSELESAQRTLQGIQQARSLTL